MIATVSMSSTRIIPMYVGGLLMPLVLGLTAAACAGEADPYSLLQIGDQAPAIRCPVSGRRFGGVQPIPWQTTAREFVGHLVRAMPGRNARNPRALREVR